MTISAKIIADSISPAGVRLTTMQLRYPRFIHPEELTHRVISTQPESIIIQKIADGLMYDENLSRNASSSRAIPVNRLIDDIIADTAMPIHWGKNQPGMQAREEHDARVTLPALEFGELWTFGEMDRVPKDHGQRPMRLTTKDVHPIAAWIDARDYAIQVARAFDAAGYHKQIVNRLLEPFSHINVVVTATEWDNFYELRRHEDAQPEIHALADAMYEAQAASKPKLLQPGEWHLPYITVGEFLDDQMSDDQRIKCSVARCARVSYLTHDGLQPLPEKDLELYDRLVGAVPLHASPAEHQATPDDFNPYSEEWMKPHLHGNFVGWVQNRKLLEINR